MGPEVEQPERDLSEEERRRRAAADVAGEHAAAIEGLATSGTGERTRSLAYNFRLDNFASRLETKEAGCATLLEEDLTKSLIADLLLSPALERGERIDYWAVSGATSVTEKARLTVSDIFSGPKGVTGFIERLETQLSELSALQERESLLRTEVHDLERDRQVDEDTVSKKRREHDEAYQKRHKKNAEISIVDQGLVLLAEDEKSLKGKPGEDGKPTENVEDRVRNKLKELETFSDAAIAAGNLAQHRTDFVTRCSDIGVLVDMMLDGRFQLSMEEISLLISLPGLTEPVDKAFDILKDLDRGKGFDENGNISDDSPLPGHGYSLCAKEKVGGRTKRKFKADLIAQVVEETGASEYLAGRAVEIVQAVREVFFLNAFYNHPRDEHDQIIGVERKEKERKVVGSAYGIVPPDNLKIHDLAQRIKNEFDKGRPVPIGTVKRDLPDMCFLSRLHFMKTEADESVHQLLYVDGRKLSDVLSNLTEGSYFGSGVIAFNAMRLYPDIFGLSVENLEIASGEAKRIESSAMKTAAEAAKIHKRLQNSRGATINALEGPEAAKIEVARVTMNIIGGVLRYNVFHDPARGGRIANDEGTLDLGIQWATTILESLVADTNRVLTPRQAAFLSAMTFRVDPLDRPSDLLTISRDDAKVPELRALLLEGFDPGAYSSGGVIMESTHYQLSGINPKDARKTRNAAIAVAMKGTEVFMKDVQIREGKTEILEKDYEDAKKGKPAIPGRGLGGELLRFLKK